MTTVSRDALLEVLLRPLARLVVDAGRNLGSARAEERTEESDAAWNPTRVHDQAAMTHEARESVAARPSEQRESIAGGAMAARAETPMRRALGRSPMDGAARDATANVGATSPSLEVAETPVRRDVLRIRLRPGIATGANHATMMQQEPRLSSSPAPSEPKPLINPAPQDEQQPLGQASAPQPVIALPALQGNPVMVSPRRVGAIPESPVRVVDVRTNGRVVLRRAAPRATPPGAPVMQRPAPVTAPLEAVPPNDGGYPPSHTGPRAVERAMAPAVGLRDVLRDLSRPESTPLRPQIAISGSSPPSSASVVAIPASAMDSLEEQLADVLRAAARRDGLEV